MDISGQCLMKALHTQEVMDRLRSWRRPLCCVAASGRRGDQETRARAQPPVSDRGWRGRRWAWPADGT